MLTVKHALALIEDLNTRLDRVYVELLTPDSGQPVLMDGIELNNKQQEAVDLALAGENFVLTGAAGTGKTLTVNAIAKALLDCKATEANPDPHPLPMVTFRNPLGGVNDQETKSAIAFVAFTNRAVNNMANNLRRLSPDLVDDLYSNFMTIHKLIEVAPEYYYDADTGKDKMRFTPRRDTLNRLPIKTLVIEEASMVDLSLWDKLFSALLPDCQIILLGDLNQLPPVFGDAILNYGLIKLPVVELTHVYRQALDSPIIRQMHQVLKGKLPVTDTDDFQVVYGNMTRNKPLGADKTGMQVAGLMRKLFIAGKYNPIQDMILSPFNKAGCGTIMLNKLISMWLDDQCKLEGSPRTVYEIIASMNKHYYAVGDLVYDSQSKMQGVISDIHINGNYYGNTPLAASTDLTRFGYHDGEGDEGLEELTPTGTPDYTNFNVTDIVSGDLALEAEAEKKMLAASHVITVKLEDNTEVERSSAGEVNALDFGYCLTCHKAQGCEWENVFIVLHKSHFIANREWLYTAGTRAKKTCNIITKPDTLEAVMKRQRIKGNSLEVKINAFNENLMKKKDANETIQQVTFNRREYNEIQ